MALFFINRLDEDFGQYHSLIGVMKRRLGWINPYNEEIFDDDVEELETNYGPFRDPTGHYNVRLYYMFVQYLECIVFVSSFLIPLVYFGCAM